MGQPDFQVGPAFALLPGESHPKASRRILVVSEKELCKSDRTPLAESLKPHVVINVGDYHTAEEKLREVEYPVHVVHLGLNSGVTLAEKIRDVKGDTNSIFLVGEVGSINEIKGRALSMLFRKKILMP